MGAKRENGSATFCQRTWHHRVRARRNATKAALLHDSSSGERPGARPPAAAENGVKCAAVSGKVYRPGEKAVSWLKRLRERAERMEPLSVREVAELLGVTPQHVYNMLDRDQIPGALPDSQHTIQFCPKTLLDWLEYKLALK